MNALRVKKAEEFHSAGGERVAQASYCNDAERLTDSVSEIVEEVDELCLDDQILSALDYPDICSKSLPKCNGKSVNSKHCATAVVSSGEGDDDSEEEETFQGYMPLPQDSDEDPDTYGGSLVMMNRADFGGDLSHQQCGTKQDVLCGAGGKDLGGAGAAKPSALGEGIQIETIQPCHVLDICNYILEGPCVLT